MDFNQERISAIRKAFGCSEAVAVGMYIDEIHSRITIDIENAKIIEKEQTGK